MFIKKHLLAGGKKNPEKLQIRNSCVGFFQARKLTIKWHLSEILRFQNLLKSRKLLPVEKFGNIHFTYISR